ncbi:MAG: DUF1573 domain-containing protein [Candidatus Dadabacteria bacterium]
MKKLLLIAVAFVAGFSVMAQQQTADQVIKVSADKYDFGKIKQGVPVTTYFEVKNITDKPVVVENAWAGCGCTTPEISKEPIAPNASTKLKVGYNAAAMGAFNKTVFVKLAGVQDPKQIIISGEVLDATAYDAANKGAKEVSSATTTAASTTPATTVKEKKKETSTKTKKKTTTSK